MFGQVPVGTLLSGVEMGFLGMESLTSQNQFLLGLGINSDNQDSLVYTQVVLNNIILFNLVIS